MSVLKKRDDDPVLHKAPSEQSAQGAVPKPGEPVIPEELKPPTIPPPEMPPAVPADKSADV